MKKCARIFAISSAILLGLFLLFVSAEHFRGEFTLHSWLKGIAAKGEKLEYAELLPPKIAPNQNAALDLVALTNALRDLSKLSEESPPMMKLASPGIAISYWQRNSWTNGDKTNTWEEFGPKIEAAGSTLAQLQSAWSKPAYDDGFDYSNGLVDFPPMPLLISCKQSAISFSEAVANDLSRAAPAAAQSHLCSLLAVVNGLGQQPLIISQMVRIACASYAFNATWEALQITNWTDAQLGEMQAAWERNNFSTMMKKSFEMERALTFDCFRQIRASRAVEIAHLAREEQLTESFAAAFGYSGLPTHGFVLHNLHLPLWRAAWAAQDELRALERWQPIIEGGRAADEKSWLEAKKFFPDFDPYAESYLPFETTEAKPLGWYDRCRFLFSEEPLSINGVVVLKVLKIETQKTMAVAAIALRRYQLRHGKPAKDVAALMPEFIAALPIDRMDGKPLRYHLNPDGSFKLYSVGVNGTDEGGDPKPEKTVEVVHNIWEGKDAVWPTAVEESK